jgi:hypothetical protein
MTTQITERTILVKDRVRKIASKNPNAFVNAMTEAKTMSDGRVKTKDNIFIRKIKDLIVLF